RQEMALLPILARPRRLRLSPAVVSKSYFVTDDNGAARFARQEGIRVVATWDLIRLAHKTGIMTEADAWAAAQALDANRRGRPPCAVGRPAFVAWLGS
ncbi:MAG TPA: hypothetical protein VGD12_08550, partial [Blastococcus sp.]